MLFIIYSVTLLLFSHPVLLDSLRPHGLQHNRPPSPLPSPEVWPSSSPYSEPSADLSSLAAFKCSFWNFHDNTLP